MTEQLDRFLSSLTRLGPDRYRHLGLTQDLFRQPDFQKKVLEPGVDRIKLILEEGGIVDYNGERLSNRWGYFNFQDKVEREALMELIRARNIVEIKSRVLRDSYGCEVPRSSPGQTGMLYYLVNSGVLERVGYEIKPDGHPWFDIYEGTTAADSDLFLLMHGPLTHILTGLGSSRYISSSKLLTSLIMIKLADEYGLGQVQT